MIDTIYVAGKNDVACNILTHIKKCYGHLNLFAVPNRTDSGVHSWQRSLKLWATSLGVPVVSLEHAYSSQNSIFLSLEFDQIIKPELFSSRHLLNLHFSALPAYKGMYTAALPILHGKSSTGVTLHVIDAGIDTGPVIASRTVEIGARTVCSELYFRLMKEGQSLIEDLLPSLLRGEYSTVAQSASGSSYFPKSTLDYRNLSVDMSCTAEQLVNQVRAYIFRVYQLPKVFGVPVVRANVIGQRSKLKPGKLVYQDNSVLVVSTIDYDVECRIDRLDTVLGLCHNARWGEVKALLHNLVCIDDQEPQRGWSPLIVAAYNSNLDVLDGLLDAGADPNLSNFKGTTPLMYAKDGALSSGELCCFARLLQAGASPLICDLMNKNLYDYTSESQQKFLGF